jgi:hypothetical protein
LVLKIDHRIFTVFLKLEFWTPGLNSWAFYMSDLATHLYMPNKETVMVKGGERRFVTGTHHVERGKASISAYLQPSSRYRREF